MGLLSSSCCHLLAWSVFPALIKSHWCLLRCCRCGTAYHVLCVGDGCVLKQHGLINRGLGLKTFVVAISISSIFRRPSFNIKPSFFLFHPFSCQPWRPCRSAWVRPNLRSRSSTLSTPASRFTKAPTPFLIFLWWKYARKGRKFKEFFRIVDSVDSVTKDDQDATRKATEEDPTSIGKLPLPVQPGDALGESCHYQIVIDSGRNKVLVFFHCAAALPLGSVRVFSKGKGRVLR